MLNLLDSLCWEWMAQRVGVSCKGFFLLLCFLLVSSAGLWFFRFSSATLFLRVPAPRWITPKLQSFWGCPHSSVGYPHATVPQSGPPPRVCLWPLAVADFFKFVGTGCHMPTPNQNNPLENSLSCNSASLRCICSAGRLEDQFSNTSSALEFITLNSLNRDHNL